MLSAYWRVCRTLPPTFASLNRFASRTFSAAHSSPFSRLATGDSDRAAGDGVSALFHDHRATTRVVGNLNGDAHRAHTDSRAEVAADAHRERAIEVTAGEGEEPTPRRDRGRESADRREGLGRLRRTRGARYHAGNRSRSGVHDDTAGLHCAGAHAARTNGARSGLHRPRGPRHLRGRVHHGARTNGSGGLVRGDDHRAWTNGTNGSRRPRRGDRNRARANGSGRLVWGDRHGAGGRRVGARRPRTNANRRTGRLRGTARDGAAWTRRSPADGAAGTRRLRWASRSNRDRSCGAPRVGSGLHGAARARRLTRRGSHRHGPTLALRLPRPRRLCVDRRSGLCVSAALRSRSRSHGDGAASVTRSTRAGADQDVLNGRLSRTLLHVRTSASRRPDVDRNAIGAVVHRVDLVVATMPVAWVVAVAVVVVRAHADGRLPNVSALTRLFPVTRDPHPASAFLRPVAVDPRRGLRRLRPLRHRGAHRGGGLLNGHVTRS